MNVIVTMFDKINGGFCGETVRTLPTFFQASAGIVEPDEYLTYIDPVFAKYDCLVEVV